MRSIDLMGRSALGIVADMLHLEKVRARCPLVSGNLSTMPKLHLLLGLNSNPENHYDITIAGASHTEQSSFSERTRSREVRLYRRPRLGAPIHFRGGEPEMVDPPSRSKPGTPPREEVQRARTVIVPSTDSVEDIVAKLCPGRFKHPTEARRGTQDSLFRAGRLSAGHGST